jgi:diguanylate cyclase (GGDEF)-like protein
MAAAADPPLTDVDVDLRVRSVRIGVWLSVAIAILGEIFLALSWDRPHRSVLAVVFLGVILSTLPLARLPLERLVRSRWREPLFLTWSLGVQLVTGVTIWLDGGSGSPTVMVMTLAVIFAGLSYPPRMVFLVGGLSVAIYALGSLAAGSAPSPQMFLVASCVAVAAFMCAWQAEDRERQRAELVDMARTDPLTGCLNRRGFGDVLEHHLRHAGHFGLVTFDLDGFKLVNDRDGHAAGDALLRWTADALRGAVEPGGFVGRLGGDEFAVLLPAASRTRATEVGDRLRAELAPRSPATTGVACMPGDGITAADLHRQADSELYAGKRRRAAHTATAGEVLVSAAPPRTSLPPGLDPAPAAR